MPLRVAVGVGLEQRRGISLFLGDGQQVSGCVVGVIISEIGFCLSRLVICLRRQLVLAIISILDELVIFPGALPDFLQVSDVVVNVLLPSRSMPLSLPRRTLRNSTCALPRFQLTSRYA